MVLGVQVLRQVSLVNKNLGFRPIDTETPKSHNITTMSASLDMSEFLTKARRLIPFLPPLPLSPRGALEQDACLLYSRLPPELRMLIWEAYLGAHAVHVCRYSSLKKLRAKECLGWETDDRGPHFSQCGRAKVQCNHIALLLTCKKM